MKQYGYPTAFSVWGEEEKEAMARVMASGNFTCGEEVEAFEEEFARWHGVDYAVMCNSGSSANLLMIAALSEFRTFERGDVVAVPALAWSTTYAPLVQFGLSLRLMDCDATWNANTIQLPEDAFYPPGVLRLVLGCSILGNPANLTKLKGESNRAGVPFIEDNCESFGAVHRRADGESHLCGSVGALASFSFFYSHQISAVEGGAVITNSAELARRMRSLRSHGWTRGLETPQGFSTEYLFNYFGYNVRPTEMHAAIARAQLPKQLDHRTLRYNNWLYFRGLFWEQLGTIEGIDLPTVGNGFVNPFGLAFAVPAHKRQHVVNALRAADIDCRPPTGGSFSRHPYGRTCAYQSTPNADRIHDTGLFLGNGPLDLSAQIEKAVKIIKEQLVK